MLILLDPNSLSEADIFRKCGLDGAKMAPYSTATEHIMIRMIILLLIILHLNNDNASNSNSAAGHGSQWNSRPSDVAELAIDIHHLDTRESCTEKHFPAQASFSNPA